MLVCSEFDGEFSTHLIVDAITAAGSTVKVSSLWILPISVKGIECKAMSDSGAEVPVVSSRLIILGNHEVVGRVTLRSVFDHTRNAPLVNLTMTRPLYSPPSWRVRQLQRWAWERVGRGKLLLRCRLLSGARRFGGHGGRRGAGHIVAAARLQLVIIII